MINEIHQIVLNNGQNTWTYQYSVLSYKNLTHFDVKEKKNRKENQPGLYDFSKEFLWANRRKMAVWVAISAVLGEDHRVAANDQDWGKIIYQHQKNTWCRTVFLLMRLLSQRSIVYLSITTVAQSHQIAGYKLRPTLHSEETIDAYSVGRLRCKKTVRSSTIVTKAFCIVTLIMFAWTGHDGILLSMTKKR